MREKKKGVYQKYLKNLLDRLLALVGTAGGPERAVFLHIQVPHDAYRHAA